jgi:Raf kinase inhibitor-like YbhB/YbcL family protein
MTMALQITSPAFRPGDDVPTKHTCDGQDVSPALEWSDPPDGTRSLALICDDPDAPRGTWSHWVLYNLPPSARGLPEAVPPDKSLPDGSMQGKNDFGRIGYGGPCPPRGSKHRYFYRLYALDAAPNLAPGATRQALLDAMRGHILAEAELMGRYGR